MLFNKNESFIGSIFLIQVVSLKLKGKSKICFFQVLVMTWKNAPAKKVQVENKNLTERCRISHFLKKSAQNQISPVIFACNLKKMCVKYK